MKNLWKMTKEELVVECKRLSSENERLQDELNNLSDSYTEIENQCADAVNLLDSESVIKDVDHFKFRLELEGLLTPQMKSFIDSYLKWYNEGR